MRLKTFAAILATICFLPSVASAQFGFTFGPGVDGSNIVGAALPTCDADTRSNYIIVDAVSPTTCDGGGSPLFSQLNYCVCDKNTLTWKVLVSTIGGGGGGGAVDSVFGRTGAVTAQSGDYSIGQVTGGIASSTLASTASGQGASLIGVEDAGGNFTAADVEAILAELRSMIVPGTDDQTASEVSFVNTVTGFVATQVQDAIDELYTWAYPWLGGPRVVHNETELEAAFRSCDQVLGGTTSIQCDVRLADDFVVNPASTSPLAFNLPVGGADGPRVSIDAGGKFLSRRVDPTGGGEWDGCAVLLNVTNVGGTCGTPAGAYSTEPGCNGLAHDYEVLFSNATVTNDSTACDGFSPGTSCGRKALCFNSDYLYAGAAGGGGQHYGGRLGIDNVKIGAEVSTAGTSTYQYLSRADDVGLKVGLNTTMVSVGPGVQFDGAHAIAVHPDPAGVASSSAMQIHANGVRYNNTNGASNAHGFYDVTAEGIGSIPMRFTGEINLVQGILGEVNGGAFDLSVVGGWNYANPPCYDATDPPLWLDSGTDSTQPVSGRIIRVGEWCTQGLMQAGAYDGFVLEDIPFGTAVPGFLVSDSTLSGAGKTRVPPLQVPTGGAVDNARYIVQPANPSLLTASAIASLASLADADVVSGAAMVDANSIYELDLGPMGFYRAVGTTPTVTSSRTPSDMALSSDAGTFLLSGSYALPGTSFSTCFNNGGLVDCSGPIHFNLAKTNEANSFGPAASINATTIGSLILKMQADCSAIVANGSICWDSDDFILYVGNGSVAVASGSGTDDQTAAEVSYDNSTSGRTGTDVQAVIDEIDSEVDGLSAGGGAPLSAQYWTAIADATLPNEVIVNDLTTLNSALGGTTIADGPHTTNAANLTSGLIPAARVDTAHIDAITEIAASLKSGTGTSLITAGGGLGALFIIPMSDGSGNLVASGVDFTTVARNSLVGNTFTNANDFSTGSSVLLPRGTSCSGVITEGSVCWETGNDRLFVGTAAAALRMQGWDADLDTIAALTPSAGAVMFGNGSAWAADLTPAIVGTDFTGTAASLTAGAATALAANPSNCSAGSAPRGVAASGAAEDCTDYLEPTDVPNVTVGDTVCASLTTCTQGSIHFDTTPAGTVTPCYCVAADTWEPGT